MRIGILSNNEGRRNAVLSAVQRGGHVYALNPAEYGHLDLLIVAGWPKRLKKAEYDAPKHGTWNCHAGPVPEYRGGSPLNWQIIDGKSQIGVSLLKMDAGFDTGDVIATGEFTLFDDETIKEAHEKANSLFERLVFSSLARFDSLVPRPQRNFETYRRQRNDDMGEIDLSWKPERIVDFVRALTHPYPGAWIRVGEEKLRIWEVSYDAKDSPS